MDHVLFLLLLTNTIWKYITIILSCLNYSIIIKDEKW